MQGQVLVHLCPRTEVPNPWAGAHHKAVTYSELANASGWSEHAYTQLNLSNITFVEFFPFFLFIFWKQTQSKQQWGVK